MVQASEQQLSALSAYLNELDRWNRRLNLTTVRPDQAWRRHVEESAELLDVAAPAAAARVVDVGSGGGTPGIVIAILRPDLALTLLDSDARKAAFLRHVAGMLGLANARVAELRAETAGHEPGMREAFDLAVSRATAPPRVLCELTLPLVRPGGRLCAAVADPAGAARDCAVAAAELGGDPPFAAGAAALVVVKREPTGARYPRRPGLPKRRPLG